MWIKNQFENWLTTKTLMRFFNYETRLIFMIIIIFIFLNKKLKTKGPVRFFLSFFS